ncbi:unnamed protein product [Schistosoma intercalatum]|nr:unnamed protein product [Schistosoma intercalatum]
MNKVACDLEGTDVYQNDLIVHGSDKVVHDDGLIVLLRHLIKKNITVNRNNYSFCIPSFEFIGYLVDGNGFRPDMKRLASPTSATSSKNLTEVRSPVGIFQYYSRLIPSCSCCANSLFNILTSNLFKLSYSQTQLEALAVFWADKRPHKYLLGKKFTIVTDHEALKFIYHPERSSARSSAAMVQRWSIALSSYGYTVQHRSVKQTQHVDNIPRQSPQNGPGNNSDCFLVQPVESKLRFELRNDCVSSLDTRYYRVESKISDYASDSSRFNYKYKYTSLSKQILPPSHSTNNCSTSMQIKIRINKQIDKRYKKLPREQKNVILSFLDRSRTDSIGR